MSGRTSGVAIGAAAAAVVVIALVAYGVPNVMMIGGGVDVTQQNETRPAWNTVGAFGINKHTYKLGEDVFFAGTLAPDQQVVIRVASPEQKVFLVKAYSGIDRELAKFYFRPDTSASKDIYEKDELVGRWMIWFEGINNDEIYFEVVDEFVPGTENDITDLKRPGADPGAAGGGGDPGIVGPVTPAPP